MTTSASSSNLPNARVAVVGAGITGLSAAGRLVELIPNATLMVFEKSNRVGGVLQSTEHDGFCVEMGPDSFVTQPPYAVQMCERIGVADDLIGTNDEFRQAFIIRKGRLRPLPDGFSLMAPTRIWPLVTTPTLSLFAKARMGCELLIPARRDEEDETLAAFSRRRFGREAAERLMEPMVSGIFMADSERLSMKATMRKFYDMERKQGSLIVAMRREMVARRKRMKSGSGPRYGLFMTHRDGIENMALAAANRLPEGCLRLNEAVNKLTRRDENGWTITTTSGATGETASHDVDAVIVAVPAHTSAPLFDSLDASLRDDLGGIDHSGCAIVISVYHREDVGHRLNGFGFLAPQVENCRIQACTFSSTKFAGRGAPERIQLRTFLGGAYRPELLERSDAELGTIVDEELQSLLGVRAAPEFRTVARWPRLMPQYDVGHLDLVGRIEEKAKKLGALRLAGNAFRGVGITHCVHSGEQAAEEIAELLQ